jgi:hypothetical protein
MQPPIKVDLPHRLGTEEAKRRIGGGIGKLKDHIPGGSADVSSSWSGDVMNLEVKALGQEVRARLDVQEDKVRLEVVLPPMLSFLARPIEALVRSQGTELLEDKTKK